MDQRQQQPFQQQDQQNDQQLLLALKISKEHFQQQQLLQQNHDYQPHSQSQAICQTNSNVGQNTENQANFYHGSVQNQNYYEIPQLKESQQQTYQHNWNGQFNRHRQRHGRGCGPREWGRFREGKQQNEAKEGEHWKWGPQQGWGQQHPWNGYHGWQMGRHQGWGEGGHHPGWGMNQQGSYPHHHPFMQMMANQHQHQYQQGFHPWGNFWGNNHWQWQHHQSHNENYSNEESQNQQGQHCRFRGRGGRGRGGRGGKGRGGCRERWERDSWKKQNKKQRNDSSTSSNSSSSSSKQKKTLQKESRNKLSFKQKQHLNSKNDIQDLNNTLEKMSFSCKQQKVKYGQILDNLKYFFEKYKFSEKTQHKIMKYLYDNKLSDEKLGELVSILYQLEQANQNYFNYLGFLSIIKQTFKRRFELGDIKQKLDKKIAIKLKKQVNDSKFKTKFPKPAFINFLQIEQLLDLNLNKTLFLIDGNNIMPKQKIFRSYFQSEKQKLKAQGQIRLAWLFSLTLNFQLFFDNQYKDQLYSKIKNKIIVSSQQKEDVDNSSVYYADKHINEQNTADMKILDRLTEIKKSQKYKDHTIILVSADKQLAQLCAQIQPHIQQTSGLYIFKFCKEVIRRKFYNQVAMKGIIKLIFTF